MGLKRRPVNQYIQFPESFETESYDGGGNRVSVTPTGLHLSSNRRTVFVNYSGDDAQDAYILMELPADPEVMRKIADGFAEMAAKMEGK